MLLALLISIKIDSPGSIAKPIGVVAPQSNSILVVLAKLVDERRPNGCPAADTVLPVPGAVKTDGVVVEESVRSK